MVRRYFLAGNWKMHKTRDEAAALAKALVPVAESVEHRVLVAPPFTALSAVSEVVEGTRLLLGAQNMASEEQGAHTGEVSVLMLKDCGVSIVILGHSERRIIYGETDEIINKKVTLALDHGLDVILCVGETLEEREAGDAERVVKTQLNGCLAGIGEELLERITIAYEPVWAIGTGKTATPDDADAIHQVVRQTISGLYSADAAQKIVIQYGGSVKPANVKDLMSMENIDGALVGGAALDAESFGAIVTFDS